MTIRTRALISAAILAISGLVLGTVLINEARADLGTNVTVERTGFNYGRRFEINVDGPVQLDVRRAQSMSSWGGCHTVLAGSTGPHRNKYPVGANCDGPGGVIGDTPVYNYGSCVDGVNIVDNLIVLADGAEVFNDTDRYGACAPVTTTTTVPPTTTTTEPPTTTTTIPGTRYCISYVVKPFRHCVRWSS